MKQVIYIGGGDSFRTEEDFNYALQKRKYIPFQKNKIWNSWLKDQLKNEYEVESMIMPNKHNARYKSWKIWFEKILPFLDEKKLVIIGHSLGALFLVKYISENGFPKKIKQLHLVAGCFDEETLPQDHSWDYLADFVLDINSIFHVEEYTNKIFLYHSKDDPIVPFVHLKKFSNYLPNAIVNVFEDRGHFSQSEFPELLENILKDK